LAGIFLAGALVFLPSIRTPFFLDDYLQRAMVEGTFPVHRNPLDLYDFVDDAVRPVLFARGFLPWWAHPQLTIRFLRPLSSALLWVDHTVFRGHALLMHLHSVAWWAFAVLAVRALYRRAFSARIALIATVIFALAPCHTMPLAWLANREAIVSLAFGALALSAHTRWRDKGRPRDALVAGALFALAFLGGGEYALCFGGYALALELTRRRTLGARALGLLPFGAPALAYLAVRASFGYGAIGSGFYADPIKAPLAFLGSVPWRFVALLANGWLSLEAHTYALGPPWVAGLVVAAALAVALVPMRRAFACLEEEPRRTATWLALGSILCLAPVLAVAPSPRVLGVATIGIAAAIAIVLDHAWFPSQREARRGAAELTQLTAVALGFAHLVHGPVSAWLEARHIRSDAVQFASRAAWLRHRVDPGTAEIGVVRGLAMTMFMPFAIDAQAHPPRAWRLLSHCGHVLVLRRDEKTLELVVPRARSLFPEAELSLWRSTDTPFQVGDTVAAPGMKVTILDADEHGPVRARFDLEEGADARFAWFSEDYDAWHDVSLPRPGFGAPFDP
jgi:hypothetical protein